MIKFLFYSQDLFFTYILYIYMYIYKRTGRSGGILLDYCLEDVLFDSPQALGVFLFSTLFRPALRPTLLPLPLESKPFPGAKRQ
jgi:hypothetical protein